MPLEIWNNTLQKIATSIDAQRFETWFKPLSLNPSSTSEHLILTAPNQFICDFLEQHYKNTILSYVNNITSAIKQISFVASTIAEDIPQPETTLNPVSTPARSTLYPTLNRRFTFDSFVVGGSNEFSKSAALAVAQAPGKTKFNPLLLYSNVGLGKTHLLQAIGNHILATQPSLHVAYVSSEEFYLEFIDAIKNNKTKVFADKYRSADCLLVDDIQFFTGKESTQEEFFYIFNALYHNAKQIVLTSDLPPSALKGLQDRLVSRFQWGLSVDIQPPDLETRVAILKKKAEEESLNIPEEVLYFIAEKISSNIRELEGVVIRILAFASITKTDITIDLVTSILKKNNNKVKERLSIDDIIQKVADYYKVPIDNIREKNRRKEVSMCRQVAMYIAKTITNHSLKTIGLNFGGRDHSTVIHAISQIEELKQKDLDAAKDIDYLISQLKD